MKTVKTYHTKEAGRKFSGTSNKVQQLVREISSQSNTVYKVYKHSAFQELIDLNRLAVMELIQLMEDYPWVASIALAKITKALPDRLKGNRVKLSELQQFWNEEFQVFSWLLSETEKLSLEEEQQNENEEQESIAS